MNGPKPSVRDRIEAAKTELEYFARAYVEAHPDDAAVLWSEICRAKATLDALRRCAR